MWPIQDDRSHERVAALWLEETQPPELGPVGPPEKHEVRKSGVRRPFDPQSVGVGGSCEVAQNFGSIAVIVICQGSHDVTLQSTTE